MHSLVLPYPPTVNLYWRNVVVGGRARVLLSKDGRAYKQAVANLAVARGVQPISGALAITGRFYRPRRVGDLDNLIKGTLDALAGFAYHDDAQIEELHLYRFDDKDNPRAEVIVERTFNG